MRYAIVENGIVTNVVLWDGESEYADAGRLTAVSEEVSVGWTLKGKAWAAPPEPPLPDVAPASEARQAARAAVIAKYAAKWGMNPEEAELMFGSQ